MDANILISNLRQMSQVLDSEANKTNNYNSAWASYLENISFELHKQANELEQLEYNFGISLNLREDV
jgi:hypothetical protein